MKDSLERHDAILRAAVTGSNIDDAIPLAGRGEGTTLLPELQLRRGDLLVDGPDGNRAGAECCFERALDVARDLDARMSQLRAATRLCRLSRAGSSLSP